MIDAVPKVTRLRAVGDRKLRVRFGGDKQDYDIDLTGLMARRRHFAALENDAAAFANARIVEGGLGVAWPTEAEWGRLDLSATTLRRIAEEQRPMSGVDFAAWRAELGLSLTEAADLLGVSRRTVIGYLGKDQLPSV